MLHKKLYVIMPVLLGILLGNTVQAQTVSGDEGGQFVGEIYFSEPTLKEIHVRNKPDISVVLPPLHDFVGAPKFIKGKMIALVRFVDSKELAKLESQRITELKNLLKTLPQGKDTQSIEQRKEAINSFILLQFSGKSLFEFRIWDLSKPRNSKKFLKIIPANIHINEGIYSGLMGDTQPVRDQTPVLGRGYWDVNERKITWVDVTEFPSDKKVSISIYDYDFITGKTNLILQKESSVEFGSYALGETSFIKPDQALIGQQRNIITPIQALDNGFVLGIRSDIDKSFMYYFWSDQFVIPVELNGLIDIPKGFLPIGQEKRNDYQGDYLEVIAGSHYIGFYLKKELSLDEPNKIVWLDSSDLKPVATILVPRDITGHALFDPNGETVYLKSGGDVDGQVGYGTTIMRYDFHGPGSALAPTIIMDIAPYYQFMGTDTSNFLVADNWNDLGAMSYKICSIGIIPLDASKNVLKIINHMCFDGTYDSKSPLRDKYVRAAGNGFIAAFTQKKPLSVRSFGKIFYGSEDHSTKDAVVRLKNNLAYQKKAIMQGVPLFLYKY